MRSREKAEVLYLNDHLGSARAMASSIWSANYFEGIPFRDYPFGEIANQTGHRRLPGLIMPN